MDWTPHGQWAIDARGRRVPIYRLPYTLWWRLGARELPRATLRHVLDRLARQAKPNEPIKRYNSIGAVAMVVAFFVGLTFNIVLLGRGTLSPTSISSSIFFFVLPVMLVFAARRVMGIFDFAPSSLPSTLIVEAMVAEGHCPSCGQHLRNLPLADDGRTICPECGAAWRLSAHEAPPINDAGPPSLALGPHDAPEEHQLRRL